jgi:uncharacterized membrane protein YvlD (DUF360 family)
MATISPILGIGLGLWLSNYLDKNNTLIIGVSIVIIAAVLMSIVSFLRNKAIAEQNK